MTIIKDEKVFSKVYDIVMSFDEFDCRTARQMTVDIMKEHREEFKNETMFWIEKYVIAARGF
jgi:hypothetical protein